MKTYQPTTTENNCGSRRAFIKSSLVAGLGVGMLPRLLPAANSASEIPSYLKNHTELYRSNPRAAALKWFSEARFGLFMHYGLYSILGRHEWVQLRELISVAEYAKLKDRFTAEHFDAAAITDLALAANMKYVNITTRHHDSFCLFETAQTDFKSTNSPAKRDLVKELATECAKKGLGLCLYYSHGRDWRHPHAPNNDQWGGSARPKYATPEPAYATGKDHDLQKYIAFMKAQITELLTNYGPIAAIWLDGIATPLSHKDRVAEFHCQELYDYIHQMQPQVLVSYKQGLLGTEDFMAPERNWQGTPSKPLELCDTLQPKGWGYIKDDDGKHKTADQVIGMLAKAAALPANLLLNTGPLPDGKIHPEDVQTLREVGRRIKDKGFPAPKQ
jgi:alpha-L-fucosidase